jgi:hypothetical protein
LANVVIQPICHPVFQILSFPDIFADPSIKKFGDTYYLYATTDGVMFASGEPVFG